jgi:uncharacterized phage protein gp47/JayE
MISLVVARTDLSDVTDTSVFKKILAATSRELDEAYYQMTRLNDLFDLQKAAGEDLDERAKEIQPGTMKRIQARRAVGTVVFTRVATVGDVIIPVNTLLKTADGKIFKTTLQSVILNGQHNSVSVPTIADVAGADGNVPGNTIIKFGSKIPGVDSVTNGTAFSQGRDQETDDSFRTRILNFISSLSRCPPQALEFAAVGTEDTVSGKAVIFAHIFEDPVNLGLVTLYIDDGAGTAATLGTPVVGEIVTANLTGPPPGAAVGGEEFLYLASTTIDIDGSAFTISSNLRGSLTLGTNVFVNPASGLLFFSPPLSTGEIITAGYTPFSGLIPAVQKVVDGDPDDRANFPGFRAAGVLVRVLSPIVVTPTVEAILSLSPGVDRDTAVADATAAVEDYINNLGISGDIIRNKLIERIMEVDGVTDVDLSIPTGNVVILDNQIPRIAGSDIDIN